MKICIFHHRWSIYTPKHKICTLNHVYMHLWKIYCKQKDYWVPFTHHRTWIFHQYSRPHWFAVWEFFNKSSANAASPEYVRFQALIKSAARAASQDYVKLQAVIQLAASTASRETKIQAQGAHERHRQWAGGWVPWILVFLEDALPADRITACSFM